MALQPDIRVIGIGSHHGADSAGWLACEILQTQFTSRHIDWQLCRTPAQLPELLANCHNVIIIDAVLSDRPAGRVITLPWREQQENYASPCSSHGLGVLQALELAATLRQLPAHTYILGITVEPHQTDATLLVSRALPQLKQRLTEIQDTLAAS